MQQRAIRSDVAMKAQNAVMYGTRGESHLRHREEMLPI